MSAEDRRRVSAEMMARIDAVVSGHELQRSSEAAPRYIPRIDDRPLRFDEEPLTSLQHVEPRVWRVVDGTEATAAFFDGVDRARRRLAYEPVEGDVVEIDQTCPQTITLPPAVTADVSAYEPFYEPFSAPLSPEVYTAWREAHEGTLRGRLDRLRAALEEATIDVRLALLAHLHRDDR